MRANLLMVFNGKIEGSRKGGGGGSTYCLRAAETSYIKQSGLARSSPSRQIFKFTWWHRILWILLLELRLHKAIHYIYLVNR